MLHTVNISPFEKNGLDSCLRMAKAGGAVLFFEDGVIGALAGTAVADKIAARSDLKFYALGEDLAARGLGDKALVDGVEVVDYAGFVDLVAEHEASTAWL